MLPAGTALVAAGRGGGRARPQTLHPAMRVQAETAGVDRLQPLRGLASLALALCRHPTSFQGAALSGQLALLQVRTTATAPHQRSTQDSAEASA